MDASAALSLVQSEVPLAHPLSAVICDCKWLMGRFLEVHFQHNFRESNKCADILARKGYGVDFTCTVFDNPSS